MAEPWRCPACGTWLAPIVSQHRCDGDQGSAGATVTPIVPPTTGSGGATGTVTWTGSTVYGTDGNWRAAAMGTSAAGMLDRMIENAGRLAG